MRFLNGLSPSMSVRSALIAMLAFALLLTGCESSYANTTIPISETDRNSPTSLSTRSNPTMPLAGRAFVPGRRSTASLGRHTNSTGCGTSRLSATDPRSGCGSADRTGLRSNLSESSTTSISLSSPITPASRFDGFSLSDISRTVPHFSDANRATIWQISEMRPAISSRTLPTGRHERLFKRQCSGSATGRTSALLPRRNSNWRSSSRHSTRSRAIYAIFWTESSSASVSHRNRSSG